MCTAMIILFQEGPVVVVADTYNNRLALWRQRDGTVWKHLGSQGTQPGQFNCPRAVAVTKSGMLVVTDEHRVQVLTVNGAMLCVLDPSVIANGLGRLGQSLYGVTVSPGTNEIVVADFDNHRVVALTCTPEWSSLIDARAWGSCGYQRGQFFFPFGIAVSAAGDIWVAEQYNHRLSVMT